MAEVTVDGAIDAPLEDVWKVVSDFGGLIRSQGLDVEVDGDGVGALRRVKIGDAEIVERLESLDPENHSTSYSIVEGPLPATGYVATIRLSPADDGTGTAIEWFATFEPAGGLGADDVAKIIAGVYGSGIKALQRHFAR